MRGNGWTSRGRGLGRRLARGALAGLAGALVLLPVDRLEERVLGRAPAFALATLDRRLALRFWGRAPRGLLAPVSRWALRLCYGAGLGALLAAADLPFPAAVTAIAGFERFALPASGATVPWNAWSPRERALLWLHVAAFAGWMDLLNPAQAS